MNCFRTITAKIYIRGKDNYYLMQSNEKLYNEQGVVLFKNN